MGLWIRDPINSWFWVSYKAGDPRLRLWEIAVLHLVPMGVTMTTPGHTVQSIFQKILKCVAPGSLGWSAGGAVRWWGSWESCFGRSPSYLWLSGTGTCLSLSFLCSRHSNHCPWLPRNPLAPGVSHSYQAGLCHFSPTLSCLQSLEGTSALHWFLRWRLHTLGKEEKGGGGRGKVQGNFTSVKLVLQEATGYRKSLITGQRQGLLGGEMCTDWLEKLGKGMCEKMRGREPSGSWL